MKRRHPKPQYAVETVLEDLNSRFVYPDLDTKGGPISVGGGGGAPTVVVAASDASDISQDKADFVCTGVDDQDTLQAAADLLPTGGGRLLLTEGFYELSDELNLPDDITMQGMGREATYIFGSVNTFLIDMATTSVLRDLSVENSASGGGCVDVVSGRSLIHNCYFESWDSTSWSVRKSAASDLSIVSCTFDGDGDGIITTSSDASDLRVIDCVISGGNRGIYLDGGSDIWIIASTISENLDWAIEAENITGLLVLGCIFNDNGQTSGGHIYLDGEGEVAHNRFDTARNGHSIEIVGNGSRIIGGRIGLSGFSQPNTFDHINISGDRNRVTDVTLIGDADTRYGINVASGDCNIVVGNDLDDPADYGTDALNPGTNTQLTYPNDATYGDNWTDCDTSPSSP